MDMADSTHAQGRDDVRDLERQLLEVVQRQHMWLQMVLRLDPKLQASHVEALFTDICQLVLSIYQPVLCRSGSLLRQKLEELLWDAWMNLRHLPQQAFMFVQLCRRLDHPWRHPILGALLTNAPLHENEVEMFLKEEPIKMIAVRVRTLVKAKYPSFALNLLRWCGRIPRLKDNESLQLLYLRVIHQLNHSRKFERICTRLRCCVALGVLRLAQQEDGCTAFTVKLARILMMQEWLRPLNFCCTTSLLMLWLPLEHEDSLEDVLFQQAISILIPQASQPRQLLLLAKSLYKLFQTKYLSLVAKALMVALQQLLKRQPEGESWQLNAELTTDPSVTQMAEICMLAAEIYHHNINMFRLALLAKFSLVSTESNLEALRESFHNVQLSDQSFMEALFPSLVVRDQSQPMDIENNQPILTLTNDEKGLGIIMRTITCPELDVQQLWPVLLTTCEVYMQDVRVRCWHNLMIKENPSAALIQSNKKSAPNAREGKSAKPETIRVQMRGSKRNTHVKQVTLPAEEDLKTGRQKMNILSDDTPSTRDVTISSKADDKPQERPSNTQLLSVPSSVNQAGRSAGLLDSQQPPVNLTFVPADENDAMMSSSVDPLLGNSNWVPPPGGGSSSETSSDVGFLSPATTPSGPKDGNHVEDGSFNFLQHDLGGEYGIAAEETVGLDDLCNSVFADTTFVNNLALSLPGPGTSLAASATLTATATLPSTLFEEDMHNEKLAEVECRRLGGVSPIGGSLLNENELERVPGQKRSGGSIGEGKLSNKHSTPIIQTLNSHLPGWDQRSWIDTPDMPTNVSITSSTDVNCTLTVTDASRLITLMESALGMDAKCSKKNRLPVPSPSTASNKISCINKTENVAAPPRTAKTLDKNPASKKGYICQKCYKTFQWWFQLSQHIAMQHPDTDSDASWDSQEGSDQHREASSTLKSRKDKLKKKKADTKRKVKANRVYFCPRCKARPWQTTHRSDLRAHLKSLHRMSQEKSKIATEKVQMVWIGEPCSSPAENDTLRSQHLSNGRSSNKGNSSPQQEESTNVVKPVIVDCLSSHVSQQQPGMIIQLDLQAQMDGTPGPISDCAEDESFLRSSHHVKDGFYLPQASCDVSTDLAKSIVEEIPLIGQPKVAQTRSPIVPQTDNTKKQNYDAVQKKNFISDETQPSTTNTIQVCTFAQSSDMLQTKLHQTADVIEQSKLHTEICTNDMGQSYGKPTTKTPLPGQLASEMEQSGKNEIGGSATGSEQSNAVQLTEMGHPYIAKTGNLPKKVEQLHISNTVSPYRPEEIETIQQVDNLDYELKNNMKGELYNLKPIRKLELSDVPQTQIATLQTLQISEIITSGGDVDQADKTSILNVPHKTGQSDVTEADNLPDDITGTFGNVAEVRNLLNDMIEGVEMAETRYKSKGAEVYNRAESLKVVAEIEDSIIEAEKLIGETGELAKLEPMIETGALDVGLSNLTAANIVKLSSELEQNNMSGEDLLDKAGEIKKTDEDNLGKSKAHYCLMEKDNLARNYIQTNLTKNNANSVEQASYVMDEGPLFTEGTKFSTTEGDHFESSSQFSSLIESCNRRQEKAFHFNTTDAEQCGLKKENCDDQPSTSVYGSGVLNMSMRNSQINSSFWPLQRGYLSVRPEDDHDQLLMSSCSTPDHAYFEDVSCEPISDQQSLQVVKSPKSKLEEKIEGNQVDKLCKLLFEGIMEHTGAETKTIIESEVTVPVTQNVEAVVNNAGKNDAPVKKTTDERGISSTVLAGKPMKADFIHRAVQAVAHGEFSTTTNSLVNGHKGNASLNSPVEIKHSNCSQDQSQEGCTKLSQNTAQNPWKLSLKPKGKPKPKSWNTDNQESPGNLCVSPDSFSIRDLPIHPDMLKALDEDGISEPYKYSKIFMMCPGCDRPYERLKTLKWHLVLKHTGISKPFYCNLYKSVAYLQYKLGIRVCQNQLSLAQLQTSLDVAQEEFDCGEPVQDLSWMAGRMRNWSRTKSCHKEKKDSSISDVKLVKTKPSKQRTGRKTKKRTCCATCQLLPAPQHSSYKVVHTSSLQAKGKQMDDQPIKKGRYMDESQREDLTKQQSQSPPDILKEAIQAAGIYSPVKLHEDHGLVEESGGTTPHLPVQVRESSSTKGPRKSLFETWEFDHKLFETGAVTESTSDKAVDSNSSVMELTMNDPDIKKNNAQTKVKSRSHKRKTPLPPYREPERKMPKRQSKTNTEMTMTANSQKHPQNSTKQRSGELCPVCGLIINCYHDLQLHMLNEHDVPRVEQKQIMTDVKRSKKVRAGLKKHKPKDTAPAENKEAKMTICYRKEMIRKQASDHYRHKFFYHCQMCEFMTYMEKVIERHLCKDHNVLLVDTATQASELAKSSCCPVVQVNSSMETSAATSNLVSYMDHLQEPELATDLPCGEDDQLTLCSDSGSDGRRTQAAVGLLQLAQGPDWLAEQAMLGSSKLKEEGKSTSQQCATGKLKPNPIRHRGRPRKADKELKHPRKIKLDEAKPITHKLRRHSPSNLRRLRSQTELKRFCI